MWQTETVWYWLILYISLSVRHYSGRVSAAELQGFGIPTFRHLAPETSQQRRSGPQVSGALGSEPECLGSRVQAPQIGPMVQQKHPGCAKIVIQLVLAWWFLPLAPNRFNSNDERWIIPNGWWKTERWWLETSNHYSLLVRVGLEGLTLPSCIRSTSHSLWLPVVA
jgi:hypothetical protein